MGLHESAWVSHIVSVIAPATGIPDALIERHSRST